MLLTIDSSVVNNVTSEDFTVKFSTPIRLNGEWEMALIKANLWYSFYNVSSANNNNIITYVNASSVSHTLTIPSGNYTITQINSILQQFMNTNGDVSVVSGLESYAINILPNTSTLRVDVILTNGFKLDLSSPSSVAPLLGFQNILITTSQNGTSVANINNGVNVLLIHNDIIDGSYQNASTSDVMFGFVPNVPPGANIEVQPRPQLIYFSLRNSDYIYKMRMWITDQNNNIIKLNGEPVSYQLHLRPKKNLFNPTLKNY